RRAGLRRRALRAVSQQRTCLHASPAPLGAWRLAAVALADAHGPVTRRPLVSQPGIRGPPVEDAGEPSSKPAGAGGAGAPGAGVARRDPGCHLVVDTGDRDVPWSA